MFPSISNWCWCKTNIINFSSQIKNSKEKGKLKRPRATLLQPSGTSCRFYSIHFMAKDDVSRHKKGTRNAHMGVKPKLMLLMELCLFLCFLLIFESIQLGKPHLAAVQMFCFNFNFLKLSRGRAGEPVLTMQTALQQKKKMACPESPSPCWSKGFGTQYIGLLISSFV